MLRGLVLCRTRLERREEALHDIRPSAHHEGTVRHTKVGRRRLRLHVYG